MDARGRPQPNTMNKPRLHPLRKGQNQRRVFRKGGRSRSLPIGRQLIESLLLLSFSAGAFTFLSWLPQKLDAMVVVSEAIADLIRGLSQLVEAGLGLAAVILIALVVLLALTAFLAGFTRLIKACLRMIQTVPNHSSQQRGPQKFNKKRR